MSLPLSCVDIVDVLKVHSFFDFTSMKPLMDTSGKNNEIN